MTLLSLSMSKATDIPQEPLPEPWEDPADRERICTVLSTLQGMTEQGVQATLECLDEFSRLNTMPTPTKIVNTIVDCIEHNRQMVETAIQSKGLHDATMYMILCLGNLMDREMALPLLQRAHNALGARLESLQGTQTEHVKRFLSGLITIRDDYGIELTAGDFEWFGKFTNEELEKSILERGSFEAFGDLFEKFFIIIVEKRQREEEEQAHALREKQLEPKNN